MKSKIKTIDGCSRTIEIEVSDKELQTEFDQVYKDIGKVGRVPGFRPGRAPRDLIEKHYAEQAKEEVVKRAIPEYYLKAIDQQGLSPVAHPEIENVQLKKNALCFNAKIEVRPQIQLKSYKNLKIIKKRINAGPKEIEQVLQKLQQAKVHPANQAKEQGAEQLPPPELNDAFSKEMGFNTLDELKEAIGKNLNRDAERQVELDMERQLADELLKKSSFEVPQILVKNQLPEAVNQIKLNRILRGEKKEELSAQEDEIQKQAEDQAQQQVKLAFLLDEIARRENIQVTEEELQARIAEIAQSAAKDQQEVRQYLEREKLTSQLLQELTAKKTVQFLLQQANISEDTI